MDEWMDMKRWKRNTEREKANYS